MNFTITPDTIPLLDQWAYERRLKDKRNVYLNVYPEGRGVLWDTRKSRDQWAANSRLYRINVRWK